MKQVFIGVAIVMFLIAGIKLILLYGFVRDTHKVSGNLPLLVKPVATLLIAKLWILLPVTYKGPQEKTRKLTKALNRITLIFYSVFIIFILLILARFLMF